MLFICFLAFAIFGIYNSIEVKSIYTEFTDEQIQKATVHTIDQHLAYLEKEATLIQKDFEKVEQNLLLLQKQAEYVFSQTPNQLMSLPSIHLLEHPSGFHWEPSELNKDSSTTFISAHAQDKKDFIYQDLQKTKLLEPLFKQAINNEASLKAVYFILSESAWLIYPGIDVPYEVAIDKLPPDINVQDYEFYYSADQIHNPKRTLQWTEKYADVTQWGWVITALVPVYLPDGTFRGVIGADFPINKMTSRIQTLPLNTENAYAFIVDEYGSLVAGNEERFKNQFSSSYPIELTYKEEKEMTTKQIWKDDNGEHYYILSAEIPNTKWTLNFSIPEKDIVEPIQLEANEQISIKLNQFFHRLALFLLFTSGLLLILAYRLSKRIIRPVQQLTNAIQQSASGTYGGQIQVQSTDEIGQLTMTFNEMSTTIQDLIYQLKLRADILEEKVLERTRELAHTNEELLHALERLQQSEQARTELILHISHDLKTPLTKVKGYLQVIQGFDLTETQQKDYIELVLSQTNQLMTLINDLFELSSLHVDELHFEKEWYPIEFIVDHTIEMECKVETEFPISITKNYEEDLPLLFIDPNKMNRALTNILSNAIKYAKPNSEICIDCTIFTKNGHCYLQFQDNGIGIFEENLEKVFEPFYREKRIRSKIIGSGIGMSITKKIIEGHDGTIHLKSIRNEGTTIIISLPINTHG